MRAPDAQSAPDATPAPFCGDGIVNGSERCDSSPDCDSSCNFTIPNTQQAYLKASNTGENNGFGYSVAISADGNTLAVGAFRESANASGINGDETQTDDAAGTGAVYVFTRTDATWSQQAYVKASNPQHFALFGHSVSLSADGNTLAVGASGENSGATGINGEQNDTSTISAGAVYVFTRTAAAWSQQTYIKASNTTVDYNFGYRVAISADGLTLAVGSNQDSSAAIGINGDGTDDAADINALDSGSAYVFVSDGTTWSQEAYIKASRENGDAQFGSSIAISADGNTLAIGAPNEFGGATGINGDQTDLSQPSSGAVYVFTRAASTWSQLAYVKSSNTNADQGFGSALAMSNDGSTLAVGAPGEASDATGINGDQANLDDAGAGAVYVFTTDGTTWSQQAYVKASNTTAGAAFGSAVALTTDGNVLAASAISDSSQSNTINGDESDTSDENAGAAHVFTRGGSSPTWVKNAYVKAANTAAGLSFGFSIAIAADSDTLAVGGIGDDSDATGINGDGSNTSSNSSGAAYVFEYSAS